MHSTLKTNYVKALSMFDFFCCTLLGVSGVAGPLVSEVDEKTDLPTCRYVGHNPRTRAVGSPIHPNNSSLRTSG